MESSLRGKTALVMGGAKRLGRMIVESLAAEGARVVIHYHQSEEEAESLAVKFRAQGESAWTLHANLAKDEEVGRVIAHAEEMAGPLDFIVHSAAIFPPGALGDMTFEDLMVNARINAYAPFALSRDFAARCKARKQMGKVVCLLDSWIATIQRKHAAYHLSKRMLFNLVRMMALDFAPWATVNGIAPGSILPPENESELTRADWERLRSNCPLGQTGSADETTAAVIFFLRSEWITGQVIYVDGGRFLNASAYES